MAEYGRINAKDLKHFDKEAKALVVDITNAGWVGRMTRNMHLVMRAPDGTAQITLSGKSSRGRSGQNQRAVFERWVKAAAGDPEASERQEAAMAAERAEFLSGAGVHVCPDCGRPFDTARALGGHRRSHSITKKVCPDCGREVKYLESHRLRSHGRSKHDPVESLLAVLAENENLKAENRKLRAQQGL